MFPAGPVAQRVSKPMTAATREDRPAIEDCHPSPTASRWTPKPDPLSPIVARRPLQHDGIVLICPFSAALSGPVIQNQPIIFRSDVNISNCLTIPRPPPTKPPTPLKQTVTLQAPHIKLAKIRRGFLR
jgi:hypothetical protein